MREVNFVRPACHAAILLVLAFSPPMSADGQGEAVYSEAERQAHEVWDAAQFRGGLIVHLGCGDGRLTAALATGDNLVHGLESRAEMVEHARRHVRAVGPYGPVSIDRFDGVHLPYVDDQVNLLVAERLGEVTVDEALRVLAPGGVLCVRQGDTWNTTTKPRPENVAEWTHYLQDASGNPVAHDDLVGPPRHVQWVAEPRHTRSHEHTPSINAVVSSGGRIFYIADRATIASIREPAQWNVVARDAYNGITLWQRPVPVWFPHICNWGVTPRQLQRKLVAVGDRVYVTLGMLAPLTSLDAATGRTLRIYEDTLGTEEVIWHRGILLLVARDVTDQRIAELDEWARLAEQDGSPLFDRDSAEPLVNRLRAAESRAERVLMAVNAESGRLLWKKTGSDVGGLRTQSLCAGGERVLYQRGRDVVCLDLASGQERWRASAPNLRLVVGERVVCADGKTVACLSLQTGQPRWTEPASMTEIRDAFVTRDALWLGGFKPCPGKRSPSWGPYFASQRDLNSGKLLLHVEPENPGHHHRCFQNKATDRYILAGRRGVEFIDLRSGDVLWNSWIRGVCRYGVMPCNGLVYVPPHACGCYITAKLTGFYALSGGRNEGEERRTKDERQDEGVRTKDEDRLERGPAYRDNSTNDTAAVRPSSLTLRPSASWPTYRGDAERSGSTSTAVPADLQTLWQIDLGGQLTSPTVDAGRLSVASMDEHRVCGVDADTGTLVWEVSAGGRVDSPPTFSNGSALFGCRDGTVTSVRASDGALGWRLRLARQDRRITAWGQLESVSPVHGSVLIDEGVLYATAGRSSYLDGGIDLCRIEPETGKVLSRTQIYSPDSETGRQPPQSAPYAMPGALPDILSADEDFVYLRDAVYSKAGREQEEGNPHLLTLTGFLDDSWAHRSYWIYGTKCSLSTGCSGRDRKLVYGRLFAFDDETIYGYGRTSVHWSNHLQDGPYRLFAVGQSDRSTRWTSRLPIQVRALVLADETLFAAGPSVAAAAGPGTDDDVPGALLVAISAADGAELALHEIADLPVLDGMAAAGGRLYLALKNGQLVCLGANL